MYLHVCVYTYIQVRILILSIFSYMHTALLPSLMPGQRLPRLSNSDSIPQEAKIAASQRSPCMLVLFPTIALKVQVPK